MATSQDEQLPAYAETLQSADTSVPRPSAPSEPGAQTQALQIEGAQVEGAQTEGLQSGDTSVPRPSAPSEPAALEQDAARPKIRRLFSIVKCGFMKSLILIFTVFVMVLFVVWIGPTYVWGDAASDSQTIQMTHAPTSQPILLPTLHPSIPPTAYPIPSPTAEMPSIPPTAEPSQLPIMRNPTTPSPVIVTLRPTIAPLSCPNDKDFVTRDEQCRIQWTSPARLCNKVKRGYDYQYGLYPVDCGVDAWGNPTVTCNLLSLCYNETHVFDDDTIYEKSYTPPYTNDTVSCGVTRWCDSDDRCHRCSTDKACKKINVLSVFLISVFVLNV